jgi:molecular chaperone DnaJ
VLSRSNNATTAEGGAHENEGFLKSLWHNITNHPAHQKKPEDDAAPKDGKPKSEDEPKKNSGSGSG